MLTRGKLTAYVVVAAFIGIIAFLGVRSTTGPQLFPGDKIESRQCRWCNGSGKDEGGRESEDGPRRQGDGICPGCRGAKNVQVIIPGPEHPATVKGTVRDLGAFKDRFAAEQAMVESMERSQPLKPVEGAVRQAKIVFDGPKGKFDLSSGGTGRFRCALRPGEYTVTTTAEGFKEETQKLTVPPRKNPIWEERAKLVMPDDDTVVLPIFMTR